MEATRSSAAWSGDPPQLQRTPSVHPEDAMGPGRTSNTSDRAPSDATSWNTEREAGAAATPVLRSRGPELASGALTRPAPVRRLPSLAAEEPTTLSEQISAAPLEAGPPPQEQRPETPLTPSARPAMQAVARRADELTRRGFSLAERGALYSARAEFINALRVLTQALDVQSAEAIHGQALADGLRALRESDDFVPSGSRLEADLDMGPIVAAHRTPVLKEAGGRNGRVSPLAALQRYYTFAQQQLAQAGRGQPAAAMALYGLGKVQMALADQAGALERKMHGPKAMSFYQAALLVDPRNTLAANELGVLLARYGQWRDARRVLLQGVASGPRAETWHNLAVVHQHLGETELSRQAQREAILAARADAGPAPPGHPASAIHWVSPEQFTRAAPLWRSGPARDSAGAEAERTSARRSFWGSPAW